MVGSPRRTTGGGRGCRPRAPPPSVSPPSPVAPLTVLRATASTLPHRSARRRTRLACDSTTNRFLPPPDRNPRSSLYLALPLPSLPPPPLVQSRRRNPRIRASLIHTIARPQASTFLRLIGLSEAIVVEPSSRRGDTGSSFSAGMVPRDTVNAAVGRSLVQGSVMNQKCDKKVPKKIHKSEREKRKRGTQNDLFNELGAMLEPDRQNNGKACVLGETTRILKDLVLQVESLRKESITLKNESHYVVLERNELRDDNSMLRSEILELQDKLRKRQQSNPIWSQGSTRSALTVSYPTSRVLPVQHSPHLPDITTTRLSLQPVVPEQCYAAPPRELQLFPEASSASTEDSELSQEQGISNSVTRPQARYPAPAVMSSLVNTFPILPRTGEEQQYSSGTSEEQGLHRF